MNLPDHSLNTPGSHKSFESHESVLPGHRNRAWNDSTPALKEASVLGFGSLVQCEGSLPGRVRAVGLGSPTHSTS